MNILDLLPSQCPTEPGFSRLSTSLKAVLFIGALLWGGALASSASTVTLKASDGSGISSYTGSGNWNPAGAPSAGNDYFTSIYTLRTPAPTSTSGNNYIFGGDSLSVDGFGGRIIGKIGNGVTGNTIVATITTTNLILNGGDILQAGSTTGDATLIVAGNVSVTAASRLGATGAQGNGGAHFETLEITAPVSGSAALQVSGSDVNNGGASGLVKLSAANPYSGTITVSSASGLYIASAINRILQLNNLNALSNATLNLSDTQTNLVSFAAGVNSGAFNIGALAGNASQSLMDTAGSPVTLSVGGNNASTTYSGALTDSGSLVKVGSGTLTLTGANSFSGTTTVNGGELLIAPIYQAGGNVIVADGASFGVMASSVSNSATIGSLNLGGGGSTTLDFSYSLTGNPTNAALTAGTVTVNGASAVRIGGSFVVGTFPVLKYGSLSGSFSSTVAGPRGVTATLSNDVVNHIIYVTVSSVGGGIVWVGTNSISPNLWDLNTTTNWLIGGLPTVYIENVPPGDAVIFNDQGSGLVLLSNTVSPASVTISNTSVGYTFQGTGQINSSAGLTKIGSAPMTLNVPGTFSGNTVISNGALNIGFSQTFANLAGNGAVTAFSGTPTLTINNSLNTLFSGNVSAFGLTKNGSGQLAMSGSNSFSGIVLVNAGAYNVTNDGTLNATGEIKIGGTGAGTITQSSGTVIANADVNVASSGGSTGTYDLNGGTLKALSIVTAAGASSTFNFNGGVLMPLADSAAFFTNLSLANVRNGGAVIDSTNFNITIGQVLQHSSIGGDNATDGGLTKRGSGMLTLTGTGSSYTGPTFVSGGTLNLLPNSVNSLNSLTLSNGAIGFTKAYALGSLSATDLKLAGNSALTVNYDLLLNNPDPVINASGTFTTSGMTVINVAGYDFSAGQQYVLIDYNGTPLANLNNFSLGTLPMGVTASLVNNTANTSIDLMITSVSIANWVPLANSDGSGTSSFNSGVNWLDTGVPSAGNGYFTRAYTLRSPADNNPYTFGGDALSVDVGGRFIMKGTGGQIITVPNLIMNGGLVDYSITTSDNFTETLAGGVTLQPGTTSYLGVGGGASAAETLTVKAAIGGSGNLQISGVGASLLNDIGLVVLGATNTYTGATTVGAGTLLVNGANGNSPITVNTNSTLGGIGTIGGPVTVQAGGTLAPGIPVRGALTYAIGTLTAGNTSISGTVRMKIDRAASPTSDKLAASGVVVNSGATLIVTNIGSTNLMAGDTFTLFSTPVSGTFSTVSLPPLPTTGLGWANKLAVDGTIAVLTVSTINTNSPVLTNSVSGGRLTLSWPTDHTGWTLQMQTNSLGSGLGTNWVDVPGSTTTNSVSLLIVATNGATFYRLKY